MGGGSMIQNDNNPYVFMDMQQIERLQKGIQSAIFDQRRYPITINRLKINFPYDIGIFADYCDLHIGGNGFDGERTGSSFQYGSGFYNIIMGVGGDAFDNPNMFSATNIYDMILPPSQAKLAAKALIGPYKNNFSYWLGGNHDSARTHRDKQDQALGADVAEELGVPYAPYTLVLTVDMPICGSTNKKKTKICLSHEVDDPQKFIAFLLSQGEVPDIIYAEHEHSGNETMFIVEVPVYNKNGVLQGYEHHPIHYITGKTMQNSNTTYAGQKFFHNHTNVKALLFYWKYNTAWSPTSVKQPKYTLVVDPFMLLHPTENRMGMRCEQLYKLYGKPDITNFKQEMQNLSASELANKVENFTSDAQQELANFSASKHIKQIDNVEEEDYEYAR